MMYLYFVTNRLVRLFCTIQNSYIMFELKCLNQRLYESLQNKKKVYGLDWIGWVGPKLLNL